LLKLFDWINFTHISEQRIDSSNSIVDEIFGVFDVDENVLNLLDDSEDDVDHRGDHVCELMNGDVENRESPRYYISEGCDDIVLVLE
jgi:hypothetical protein